MSNTITDLWYGNIAPFDKCGAHDTEILHVSALMERNREALYSLCTLQQQELFQKYIDCSEEYLLRLTELAFCKGFALSCKLLAEAFSADSE